MNEPLRLRVGAGPARVLMGGARLDVPSASRRRALVFTGAAASMVTSGAAVAASATSLVKSVVLCVWLGTIGGGLMSLAVSETISRVEMTHVDAKQPPAPKRSAAGGSTASIAPPSVTEPVASPAPAVVVRAAAERAVARDARGNGQLPTAGGVGTPSAATTGSRKPQSGTSLFEEQRIIESARAAVARGDIASALSTLDGYERANAHGQFGPEALALRIEALSSRGELGRARTLAAEFRQRYPHHPLLSRVQTAVEREPAQ
jgi:hypothetical protein